MVDQPKRERPELQSPAVLDNLERRRTRFNGDLHLP